jgi:uncharacterized protein YegL
MLLATLCLLLASVARAGVEAGPRRVEVCFVLDTTGSMSGLLDAAKRKIWFIASEIANSPSKPEVQFCLLAFRDRGDAYVTQHLDLDADLDAVYAALIAMRAGGGGDTPEAVNQALAEAVDNTSWSTEPDVLRLIFLVGDAPPHTDYDEPQYPQIATRAAERNILINPVLCGDDVTTKAVFARIASGSGGQPAQLAQPSRVRSTDTPMDQDLAALNQRLDRSLIRYAATPDVVIDAARSTLSDSTAADRAAFAAARGRFGDNSDDLLDAIDAGRVDSAHLERERLPASLRSLSETELHQHLASVRHEREGLRRVIAALLGERRDVLTARAGDDRDHGFDQTVARIIGQQMTMPAASGSR